MKKILILFFVFAPLGSPAALNETTCANLVVTELKTILPNITGIEETLLISRWEKICKGIITHIQTSADINLLAGDITVPALGLFDSIPAPVTGSALNAPVLLPGKIQ